MKIRTNNLFLTYLLQPEDTSPGGRWRRLSSSKANTTGRQRLETIKAVLWAAIALAMACGISRLSDTPPIY